MNAIASISPRAVDDLRLALEHFQPGRPSVDGWGNRGYIEGGLGGALENHGEWLVAVDHWKQVAHFNQQRSPDQYRYAHQRLSNAYSKLGDFGQAENSLKLANDMLAQLRQTKGWAVWGFNYLQHGSAYEARFLETQGRHGETEAKWRTALSYAEKDHELKIQHFGAGSEYARGAARNLAAVRRNLAGNLATQGKYGEAEIFARQGFQDALAMNAFNTTTVASALDVVGWTRFQQGDLAGAEKYYRYALAAVEGSGVARHSRNLATRRVRLARVDFVQERWNDALKLFEERDRGLRSDAAEFNRRGSGTGGWAYVLVKTGQSQRAAEMVEREIAGAIKRPVPNRWSVAQLRGVLGIALAANGKTAEALKAYRESIPDLIRRDEDDAAEDNAGYWRAFWQRVILESYLELLAKLQVSGVAVANLDLVDESFWVADVARSSSVQGAIAATAARAQLPDRQLAELARKEQDALNRIVALNRIFARLAEAPEKERLSKITSDMRAEIGRLREEHAGLRSDIRTRYPEYAELIDPKPAGISDVRKVLVPGEALVSIYLGESQSYVWTIAAGGKAAFRVVPLKREEIESDVRELRKAVDFGDGNPAQLRPFDLARANKLYRALFEPDESLWKEAQVLNVIPHGALGELPFALLVTAPSKQPLAGAQAAYAEVPWLMRKVAIAQLPSASAFTALRRTPPGKAERQPFVGFGDPLFTADVGAGARRGVVRNLTVQKVADATESQLSAMAKGKGPQQPGAVLATRTLSQSFAQLSALPDTSDELREIAVTLKADSARDLFLNRQATEKNVKQAGLENRRVVAFATHGIASGEITGLDQPALVLATRRSPVTATTMVFSRWRKCWG